MASVSQPGIIESQVPSQVPRHVQPPAPAQTSSQPQAAAAASLDPAPPNNPDFVSAISLCTIGTCTWFLNDEHFNIWLHGTRSHNFIVPGQDATIKGINKLWLYGHIGSGRTVLAATTVDFILKLQNVRNGVCYLACNGIRGSREFDGAKILKIIVAQLASQRQASEHPLIQSQESSSMHYWGEQLLQVAKSFDLVFIVLDDIDYIRPEHLRYIASLADGPDNNLRLLFTTADGPGQRELCEETVSCPIHVSAAKDDIRLYMRNVVQDIRQGDAEYLNDQALLTIEESIASRSHGAWLWSISEVQNQLDLLKRRNWSPELAPISNAVDDYELYGPEAGNEYAATFPFNSYISRILEDQQDPLAKFILFRVTRWVFVAYTMPGMVLTVSETIDALMALLELQSLPIPSNAITEQQILQACGPLIRRHHDYFVYAHIQTHDYLVSYLPSSKTVLGELAFNVDTYQIIFRELRELRSHFATSKPEFAESLYIRLWKSREQSYGPDDLTTLNYKQDLAGFYADEDKFAQAEELLTQVIDAYRKHSPLPSELLDSLNLLGTVCTHQHRLGQAEALYLEAIRYSDEMPDSDITNKTRPLNNLGIIYANQGRHAEARAMWHRLYEFRKDDEEQRLRINNNVAMSFKQEGIYDEAALGLEISLADHERIKGPDAEVTNHVADSLAEVYASQERYQEAEALFNRVLEWHKRSGDSHEDIMNIKHSISKLYQAQGRLDEAKSLLQDIKLQYEGVLGIGCVDFLKALFTLFLVLDEMNDQLAAVDLGYKLLPWMENAVGSSDRVVLSLCDCMALLYAMQGNLTAAEPMWRKAYEGYKAKLGDRDSLTAAAVHNLGLLYKQLQRKQEAIDMLHIALNAYQGDDEMSQRVLNDLETVKASL